MSLRATKTNPNQWEVLVNFLLEHPEMVTKSFIGLDARQNYKSLWEQVATQLNSMGYGSKTTDKWIEVSFAATATTLQIRFTVTTTCRLSANGKAK